MGIAALLISLGFLSLSVHLLPFWLYGSHPLGYDTGFYRRYLIEPWTSFPNPPVPGLGDDALVPRMMLDTLRALQIPTDVVLYGSYILFFMLLPVLLYVWLAPRLGRRGAVIAALLLILSPIGYTAFWYMLYKNALALCLLVGAFIAYERRAFWPLIALSVLLPLTHKTSAIIYIATFCVLIFVDKKRWHEIATYLAVTGIVFIGVMFAIDIAPRTFASGAVAVFLSWSEYAKFSIGLMIAAAYTFLHRHELSLPPTLVAFALASFAFPTFHLPFYERIFVYTDVALVALAASGLVLLMRHLDFDARAAQSYTLFALLCVVIGLHLGNVSARVHELKPLISPTSLERITAIGPQVPSEALLLTTNSEAPWYEGWTLAHIAAPGMLRDNHDFEAWVQFWESTSTPKQIAFLHSFQQPLYISTTGTFEDLINTPPSCLAEVTPGLLRNDCD